VHLSVIVIVRAESRHGAFSRFTREPAFISETYTPTRLRSDAFDKRLRHFSDSPARRRFCLCTAKQFDEVPESGFVEQDKGSLATLARRRTRDGLP
jgi:hypothetical protein